MPFCWNSVISWSVLPRIRSRLCAGFERDLGRAQVVLGGIEHGTRVLHLLERDRFAVIEQPLALVVDLRQIERGPRLVERGRGRDEVVLRLHHVGGFDSEQRLSHDTVSPGLTNSFVTRPA